MDRVSSTAPTRRDASVRHEDASSDGAARSLARFGGFWCDWLASSPSFLRACSAFGFCESLGRIETRPII